MTEFRGQDLTGARFEQVELREATFSQVSLTDASLRRVDFSAAQIRGAVFIRSRLLGVELVDVEISGDLRGVVVNGVDIAPLIDAELNRRTPERAKMHPTDADGFREAWAILERLWEGTVARARALPEAALHRDVDGEWSFIQTLRHLNFAGAAWVGRMILGNPSPWHPLDLPWDEAPGWAGIPWDREARPSLDEVLAVRRERRTMVRKVMESLTDDQLAAEVSRPEPGWPRLDGVPVSECLHIVLNEEWQHRLYAERDLTTVERDLAPAAEVALRPVEDSDLDTLFDLMRDPESVRMAAFTAKDPDDRHAFDAHMAKILASPDTTNRSITRDGRLVGSIASFVVDGDTEITYWIDRSVWGQGIASRALAALLDLVPTRPLHARAASDNIGSLKVLQAAGFRIIGTEVSYANARRTEIEETLLRLD